MAKDLKNPPKRKQIHTPKHLQKKSTPSRVRPVTTKGQTSIASHRKIERHSSRSSRLEPSRTSGNTSIDSWGPRLGETLNDRWSGSGRMSDSETRGRKSKKRRAAGSGVNLMKAIPTMYFVYIGIFIAIVLIFNSLFGGALGGVAWLLGVDPFTMSIMIGMLALVVTLLFINIFRR